MRRAGPIVALFVVSISLAALLGYRLALRNLSRPFTERGGATGGGASRGQPGQSMAGCVDFHDAGQHTGETTCISGRVLRVYVSRSESVFLDFCPNYRDCPFSSVIFASDRTKFGDLNALNGREVEIQGRISIYNSRAEIVIRDPEQVHVLP
jgi:hypothetical protein